jgi:uncharacterized protein (TIGR02466 family)
MIENLFPTPIYYNIVDNLDEIQDELNACLVESVNFIMNEKWGKTHYMSDPTFETNLILDYNLKIFQENLDLHFNRYCVEAGLPLRPYKISSSWMSLFKKDNYGHIHNHGGVDISGVYYLQTNQEDGKIFFLCPTPSMETSLGYQDLAIRWEHSPLVGKILLFPGWLSHGIQTNTTDSQRVSISFNINFIR